MKSALHILRYHYSKTRPTVHTVNKHKSVSYGNFKSFHQLCFFIAQSHLLSCLCVFVCFCHKTTKIILQIIQSSKVKSRIPWTIPYIKPQVFLFPFTKEARHVHTLPITGKALEKTWTTAFSHIQYLVVKRSN